MAVILDNKEPRSPSVFRPEALLREARRQKGIPSRTKVPAICILDPDGDVVRMLRESGSAKGFSGWPCYHTELDTFLLDGRLVGIVGRVAGASFAVLVAEELVASGCRLLISLTSAGQITPAGTPPYFVVIDRALRDEGTSYHYAAPSEFAEAMRSLSLRRQNRLRISRYAVSSGQPGRQMRHSAKRRKQSPLRSLKAFSPSKWKPLRSTLLHA
jgi:hypothetical protein